MPSNATGSLLKILTASNAELSLGISIGQVVVPLVIGLVKEIKTNVIGTDVEYTVVLKSNKALLDNIIASAETDIAAINAELARFGLPPLADPAAPLKP